MTRDSSPADTTAEGIRPESETRRQATVQEPELERQGRRLGRPGWWFLVLAAFLALPGVLLILFTDSWALALGIVLLALAGPPAAIGLGLLLSGLVSRWAARHRSFA